MEKRERKQSDALKILNDLKKKEEESLICIL